jgi:hypothetical protein
MTERGRRQHAEAVDRAEHRVRSDPMHRPAREALVVGGGERLAHVRLVAALRRAQPDRA